MFILSFAFLGVLASAQAQDKCPEYLLKPMVVVDSGLGKVGDGILGYNGSHFAVEFPGPVPRIEVRKTESRQLVAQFSPIVGFSLEALSGDGRFGVFVNQDSRDRKAGTILMVFDLSRRTRVLRLSTIALRPALHFHFVGTQLLFVETDTELLAYQLNELDELEPRPVLELDRTEMSPSARMVALPGLSHLLVWSEGSVVRPALLDTTNFSNLLRFQNPNFQRAQSLSQGMAQNLERGTRDPRRPFLIRQTRQRIAATLQRMTHEHFLSPVVSDDGNTLVIHGAQGLGESQEGGNYENFFEFYQIKDRSVIQTLYVPDRVVTKTAISGDGTLFAFATGNQIQVVNIQRPDLTIFLGMDPSGLRVQDMHFLSNNRLVTRSAQGRFVIWNWPDREVGPRE